MSESVGDDSESSNSNSVTPPAQLDNITARSGEVWLRLCCGDETRARRKQCCLTMWRKIGIVLLVIAAIAATAGITYLWLVPYSNALAQFMWPDRPCQSLWLMCGVTTWAAWIIHIATIDVTVLGVILMCIFASRSGFQRNGGRCRYCCPIIPNFGNGRAAVDNNFIFGLSVFCLGVAAFVTLVLISLYGGRLAAFETISGCAQFKGTIMSFETGGALARCSIYAPLNPLSNVSDPVSGWVWLDWIDANLGAQCTWCQSMGFLMIFFPVVGAVAAIWLTVSIALGCAATCLACKKQYDQTRGVIVAEKRQRAIEDPSTTQSMDIE